MGFGQTEFEQDDYEEDGSSFIAGVYLGAGLSEQFLLSFRYRYFNSDIDDITYHTFLWTGDVKFFPFPDNGFFLNGGLGRCLVDPDVAYADSYSGVAFYAGAGYELTKWVFLQADYTILDLEDDLSGTSFNIAITLMGY